MSGECFHYSQAPAKTTTTIVRPIAAALHCQHEGFHEQLGDDTDTARAKRRARRDFTSPCRRAGVDENGDVHGHNQQQEPDAELEGAHGELHLRSFDAEKGARVGEGLRPDVRLTLRKRDSHPLATGRRPARASASENPAASRPNTWRDG